MHRLSQWLKFIALEYGMQEGIIKDLSACMTDYAKHLEEM